MTLQKDECAIAWPPRDLYSFDESVLQSSAIEVPGFQRKVTPFRNSRTKDKRFA
jgi:hypothetical protein